MCHATRFSAVDFELPSDDDPRRTKPNGKTSGPWHDATTAIDGAAARALGDLARERWRDATGERLEPAAGETDPWPEDLLPTIEHVNVAIARTLPVLGDRHMILRLPNHGRIQTVRR